MLDKFYINGAWADPNSSETMPVLNPAYNTQIGTVSLGNADDVNVAVAAAKAAFTSYSKWSKADRLALLHRVLEVAKTRHQDMADAITAEMGAPSTMSYASQAYSCIGHLESVIRALDAQPERVEIAGGDILTRGPIGVCGLITPWNWPLNQIALKVFPVLAAGATCVLKPSEHTPLSAQVFAQIMDEAGVPAGVFNMVYGDGPSVGAVLSRHPDVAMMSFTGSTRAGALVSQDASLTLKRVTLELGGKSPNLIFADCDVEKRVTQGVKECFYNTGQSCNAPTRMLVERSCYDAAIAIAEKAGLSQAVGDPALPGNHIGPLFDELQFHRVQKMIQMGIDEGARLLVGGMGKPEGAEQGWFVKPTIFCDVSPDMQISRQEIFGPVLVITPFDTEEEAIELANDTPYGLAAYVQTDDAERAQRVSDQLNAGAIHINGRSPGYDAPFGGYKQSGNGREGGVFGLEDYQEVKVRPAFAL